MMRRHVLLAAMLAAGFAQSTAYAGAKINIVNEDVGTGQGLDDHTAATPVGGNPGTTRGAQALIVFQFAADLWGSVVDSDVDVINTVSFAPLSCNANSGVLGSSGTNYIFAFNPGPDLPAGALANTWYHSALGDALAGTDLATENDLPADTADIISQFNGKLGASGCLTGLKWYFGLDGNTPANSINFLNVVMHEMGHGLGFSEFNDNATGAQNQDMQDIYSTFMKNDTTGKLWTSMTNAERKAAAIADGHLVFTGATVKAEAASVLTAGKNAANEVQLYAPTTLSEGSSVSHYDIRTSPNTLMEPNITDDLSADVTLDLTPALMKDVGWSVIRSNQFLLDCDTGVPASVAGGAIIGANIYGSARVFAGGAASVEAYRTAIRAHVTGLGDDGLLTPAQETSAQLCLSDTATQAQFDEWGNGGGPGPGEPTALTNKVPMAGLAGGAGSETVYSFEAKAGAVLSFMTYGGTGNVSMYVSFGTQPTTTTFDAKSTRAGNSETVRFTAPQAGVYYIKLVGAAAYSGVTLTARQ